MSRLHGMYVGLSLTLCACSAGDGSAVVSTGADAGMDASNGPGVGAGEGGTNPGGDSGSSADRDAAADAGESCDPSCGSSARCRFGTCVPDLGTCTSYDDCPGDSYCSGMGECLPYGVPAEVQNDPDCERPELPGDVQPEEQCSWSDPGGYDAVYTAPMVADLNLDGDPLRLQPSILVTGFKSEAGWRQGRLQVVDGRSCTTQITVGDLPGEQPSYGSNWAVGDLDGDVGSGGHPEIVGLHTTSTAQAAALHLYALQVDTSGAEPTLGVLWYGRDCATDTRVPLANSTHNFGPGIWDLDDDGSPEILIDTVVFDAQGCVLNEETVTPYITLGRINTVADVDLDGRPELVSAERIAAWDTATTEWVTESWFTQDLPAQPPGHIAVADLGAYSVLPDAPLPNQLPEVIIVSAENPNAFAPGTTGTVRVQALDGTTIFGPLELYHSPGSPGGHGGPPTASDFDGDGHVEFAAAANEFYTVYDPDCLESLAGASPAERPGGRCDRGDVTGLPDGVLWAQPSSDFSSSGTGSSVFDFNGDGRAEAVYGDECYVRVYDGASGDVLFSASATNGTGYEFPTIADVDGDFATEIVAGKTLKGDCPSPDPLFPESGPSVSESGFVILRDPMDRWASSRPIWNQHAYSVTHVTDDARIPRSSEVQPNWTQPGLNNFRQNTQGELGVLALADLTVVFDDLEGLCGGSGDTTLGARVCNRGTANVQDGVTVAFVEADSVQALPGTPICSTETLGLLQPGDCEPVACDGTVTDAERLFVLVDPDDEVADCHPGNNDGAALAAICGPI